MVASSSINFIVKIRHLFERELKLQWKKEKKNNNRIGSNQVSAERAHARHNRWFYFNYNFIVCVLRSLCGCRSLFHCALQSVLLVRVSNDMLIVVFFFPLFIPLNQLFIWPIEGGVLMQSSYFQFSCWKKKHEGIRTKIWTHNSTEILYWDKAENTCLIFCPSFYLVFFSRCYLLFLLLIPWQWNFIAFGIRSHVITVCSRRANRFILCAHNNNDRNRLRL